MHACIPRSMHWLWWKDGVWHVELSRNWLSRHERFMMVQLAENMDQLTSYWGKAGFIVRERYACMKCILYLDMPTFLHMSRMIGVHWVMQRLIQWIVDITSPGPAWPPALLIFPWWDCVFVGLILVMMSLLVFVIPVSSFHRLARWTTDTTNGR